MIELVTSYIVLNGLYLMYTVSYVGNSVMFYYEIQHKLGYVFHRTIPTQREVIATVQVANKSSEFVGNGYSAFTATRLRKKTKSNNLSNKSKMTYWKWFLTSLEEFALARERARQEKREKAAARLDAYRVKMEFEEDAKDQAKMEALGYTRCTVMRHYISPDQMLADSTRCALKVAQDCKKYTAEDLIELQSLMLDYKRKPRKPCDFRKYESVFKGLEVDSKHLKRSVVQTVDSVCMLQTKKIALVYENMAVIQFEHDIVA